MERTHGDSTLRSIDHTTNSQGRVLKYLSPTLQKRKQILFSADQLQYLETMFQEDPFPDLEKKRLIAASFGVRAKDIKAWFQYRRWRGRKQNPVTAAVGRGQSTAGYTPHHQISPTLPTLAHSSLGAPPVSHSSATKPPQFAPVPPSSPILSTQREPSHSSLLSSLSSPGQSREWDAAQYQLSSQGGLVWFPPYPMHDPPPLLPPPFLPPPFLPSPFLPSPLLPSPLLPSPLLPSPLLTSLLPPSPLPPPTFTAASTSADPTPPLLNTPPFFLDALAGGSTLAHHETQSLLTDTSSLFDLDDLTSSQQNNTYQLQTSYPTIQPQLQPDTSLPSMPYLTPNPPELNPSSYLTLGPSGVVATSISDPAYFQFQSTGQILLQSSDEDAGSAGYQPSPQGQPERSASRAAM